MHPHHRNPVGIMQGRLSPPRFDRVQAFPGKAWRDEFSRAHHAGLDCIEWVLEADTLHENPIRTRSGITEIKKVVRATGVDVWSVCADYFMARPLIRTDGSVDPESIPYLGRFLDLASSLNIRYMVLPFVEASSLQAGERMNGVESLVGKVAKKIEDCRIELHFETDLPPRQLRSVLGRIDHPLVLANYDIGNSASLGYDPDQELSCFGEYLGSVHVKDRMLHGSSVPLGSGNADFATCFTWFRALRYTGPFILQAARSEGMTEEELAKRNRSFVEQYLLADFTGD